MIFFENWNLRVEGQSIAQQFDHLTRTITVVGDIPEGWDWVLMVQVGEYMDLIPLTEKEGTLCTVLTAQQLSVAGYYKVQLRGTRVEQVRHTNTINVYVASSLSGEKKWPEIPSEFTELERRSAESAKEAKAAAITAQSGAEEAKAAANDANTAKTAAQDAAVNAAQSADHAATSEQAAAGHRVGAEKAALEAEGYSSHPPVIGESGNWRLWNGADYVDSGISSQGDMTRAQGNNIYANALAGTASASVIRLDDVSPLEHAVLVKVSSNNIIPYPHAETSVAGNGMKWTDNGDGTIVVNGTATATSTYQCIKVSAPCAIKAGTYTLSGCPAGGSNNTFSITLGWRKKVNDARISWADVGEGKVVTFAEDGFFDVVLAVRAGVIADGLVFKPQLEKGTVATQYATYVGDPTVVSLKACGENILTFPYANVPDSKNGLTIQTDADGTITINGTATAYTYLVLAKSLPIKKGTYFLSGCPTGGGKSTYRMYVNDGIAIDAGEGCAFEQTEDGVMSVRVLLYPNILFENLVFKPQLEIGSSTAGFRPYKATEYKPNADGTVDGVIGNGEIITLLTDAKGVLIEVVYKRDLNKALEQLQRVIISMGGNV